jgi:type III secretion protein C
LNPPARPGLLRRVLLAGWLAGAAAAPVQLQAAEPAAVPAARSSGAAWAVPRFTYKADGKRVAEVLQDFAASQGLPAVLAEGIEGTVQGSFDSAPEKFLDAISKTYSLLWYHDGQALYFYPAQAIQSRLFRLKGLRRNQVTELLEQLRLGDRRYPLRFDANEQTLLVYGPPRHVELVAAAVEQLDAGAADRNRRSVRVVPLRFASAADRQLGATRVPGLASTLTELYAGIGPSRAAEDLQAAGQAGAPPPPAAEKTRAMQGMFGNDRTLSELLSRRSEPAPAKPQAPARGARNPVTDDEDTPLFRADEGSNALLVFGRPQRMAEYLDLVARLDVRPLLVELEATIIDVSSDSVDALGVAWSAQGQRGSISVTPPADGSPPAFRIGTVWSNAGRELLSRIDALSANGKANVVAKPKVLGVANRAAVMKDRRVVAVRVQGNLEANLFQLEAGTLLQMTPYVSTSEGETRIRLALYIEDGGFEERLVDGVPVLKRMEITTEAHVLEGESLLIGGITTTVDSQQSNAVPGLSRLPLIGGLFRSNNDKRTRSERLFLITPRVIRDSARAAQGDARPEQRLEQRPE